MAQLQRFTVRSGRTVIHFGIDVVGALENWVSQFKRVYVVTSRSAARVSGALDDVVAVLRRLGVEFEHFDGVTPNPTTKAEVEALSIRLSSPAWLSSVVAGLRIILRVGGRSVEHYL